MCMCMWLDVDVDVVCFELHFEVTCYLNILDYTLSQSAMSYQSIMLTNVVHPPSFSLGICYYSLLNTNYYFILLKKGGVGKSTIAANLAYELARMGGRVGKNVLMLTMLYIYCHSLSTYSRG